MSIIKQRISQNLSKVKQGIGLYAHDIGREMVLCEAVRNVWRHRKKSWENKQKMKKLKCH